MTSSAPLPESPATSPTGSPATPLATALPASLDAIATPALLVELPRMERNIARMAEAYAAARVTLRPHVKTSKCWEVARRQLGAGAVGFTCSTPEEVDWLLGQGVPDLLWAHVPVGPAKVAFAVDAVARAERAGQRLAVALDSVAAGQSLSEAALRAGVRVPFVLEVNTGHGRAGAEPGAVPERARELAALAGLSLRGVLTHEGHLARYVGDRAGLERAGRGAGDLLAALAAGLRADGHTMDIVSVGSTPGATSAPFADGVTEARPGTYVYFDANQMRLGSAVLDECALTVLGRVVSTERPGVVVTDAGIKAMSSDAVAAAGSVGLVCDADGLPLAGVEFSDANEEHGFLTGPGTTELEVGDLVRIVPNHACGTTNMFGTLHAVADGTVVGRWPISARH